MKKTMKHARSWRAALVPGICAAVVACGGGGGDDTAAPGATPAPAAAQACGDMDALLAAINAARAQARVCEAGKPAMPAAAALSWNTALAAAADRQSADMAAHDFVSHTGSDGSTYWQRITEAGYAGKSGAENIAAGYTLTAASAVQGWLDSPGHCRNLMSASYQDLGGGCRYNPDSTYRTYWTTDYASR